MQEEKNFEGMQGNQLGKCFEHLYSDFSRTEKFSLYVGKVTVFKMWPC